MICMHLFMTFTGLSRYLSYTCKMVLPAAVVVVLAVYLLCVLSLGSSENLLLYSLYVAAVVFAAIPQGITEPATVELAGLFPSHLASKNVFAGEGFCGILVCTLTIFTRLITHGLGSLEVDTMQRLVVIFFAVLALTGIGTILVCLFMVRRTDHYRDYVEVDHAQVHDDRKTAAGVTPEMVDVVECGGCKDMSAGSEQHRVRTLFEALRYVWPSFIALFANYLTTLALWPVIPGLTCLEVGSSETSSLKSWWFDIVLVTFNLADFVSRSEPRSLSWAAKKLPSAAHLGFVFIRGLIFFPLMLTASAPQSYDPLVARWVVLIAVFWLGISNGFLTSIIFMR